MLWFDDIFDQSGAVDWLRTALAADRLPHGLIFAGPTGVGKSATAGALSAAFLCEKPQQGDACRKCGSCRSLVAGTHPDLHLVHRKLIRGLKPDSVARDLAVDVVRTYLREPAAMKPMLGRGKVFIVDEAETMNAQAQNALLKTLEEPQGRTLIVLLTTAVNQLLPTVRSRSQHVKFLPLPERRVASELQKRGISPADATAAAGIAEGSLGLSIRWLEDGLVAASREMIDRLDSVSADTPRELSDWMRQFGEGYAKKQLEKDSKASKDQVNREVLTTLFAIASNHLRKRMASTSDAGALGGICRAIESALAAERYLDANVAVVLVLDHFATALHASLAA